MSELRIEAALEQVKRGALDEYAVVVETYQRPLRAWLASLCPPGVEADEIAHRAFVETYKQIDHYQPGTNFFGWLAAIARNLLLGELKRLQRQDKNLARYLDHLEVSGLLETEPEPPEANEQRLAALRSCEELLSEQARLVLRDRYTAGDPLEKIARRLGKTVAAVKFQLFAIRKHLRECVRRKLAQAQTMPPPLTGAEMG
jgi:RNA polymerase sigma-70 factor (ECF subfamily)